MRGYVLDDSRIEVSHLQAKAFGEVLNHIEEGAPCVVCGNPTRIGRLYEWCKERVQKSKRGEQ
jgi:hypothetical protein